MVETEAGWVVRGKRGGQTAEQAEHCFAPAQRALPVLNRIIEAVGMDDARVVVHGADVKEADLPKTAIRSYPTKYIGEWTAKDGRKVRICRKCQGVVDK